MDFNYSQFSQSRYFIKQTIRQWSVVKNVWRQVPASDQKALSYRILKKRELSMKRKDRQTKTVRGAWGSWDENWTLENILILKLTSYMSYVFQWNSVLTRAKNSNSLFTLYTYSDALTEKNVRIFSTPLAFPPIRGANNVLHK